MIIRLLSSLSCCTYSTYFGPLFLPEHRPPTIFLHSPLSCVIPSSCFLVCPVLLMSSSNSGVSWSPSLSLTLGVPVRGLTANAMRLFPPVFHYAADIGRRLNFPQFLPFKCNWLIGTCVGPEYSTISPVVSRSCPDFFHLVSQNPSTTRL